MCVKRKELLANMWAGCRVARVLEMFESYYDLAISFLKLLT